MDSNIIKFNKWYNESPLTSYKNCEVFTNGKDMYGKMFKDIKGAKKCIHIQYYTIHNDSVGHELVRILTEKAKDGIEVWVMMDFIANIGTPSKMFKEFRVAGGKICRLKPYLTHYRNHKKIVVIDHEIGYIGGMNVGEQYANMAKKKNPWRDTQVRLLGECGSILEYYFYLDWICGNTKKELSKMHLHMGNIVGGGVCQNNYPIQFVSGGASSYRDSIKMCYLNIIRNAKSEIYIQSPYFIPDTSILDELKVAMTSGVKVYLMVPGIKASFFLDPVTNYFCGELLEYGAIVYKYNGYIHAKTIIADEEICCIGSVNMDIRSLEVDDEICGIFYDNEFVNNYKNIYEADIKNSKLYQFQEYESQSRWNKIKEKFFLVFAPLM